MGKKIKLEKMNTILGRLFRTAVRDDEGNTIMDIRRDGEGNPIKQVPRDEKGIAVSGAAPEIVYQARTREMGKEALCELLKLLFLNMEVGEYKMTKLDIIQGTEMFRNISKCYDGDKLKGNALELDKEVHLWIRKKLDDEKVGVKVFGVNLVIIEEALDKFERLHEPEEEKEGKEEGTEEEAPAEE